MVLVESTSEKLLLLFMLTCSVYVFVGSQNFDFNARVFPQIVSGPIIVFTLLLLFRDRLPDSIYMFVGESVTITDRIDNPQDEETVRDIDEEGKANSGNIADTTTKTGETSSPKTRRFLGVPISPTPFTALLTITYAFMSYLFGMLFMAPIFAALYGRWFELSRTAIVGLSIISTATVYGFMWLLNLPLDNGVVLQMLGVT